MNLRVKFPPFLKSLLLPTFLTSCFWLLILIILFSYLDKGKETNENSYFNNGPTQNNYEALDRKNTYEELSPNGNRKVIRYKLNYHSELFSENYTTYLNNNVILAVVEKNGDTERENFLFVGEERTGDPHWLGNKYLFFKAYCGTSCQGLVLLDTENNQVWKGALGYFSGKDEKPRTSFSGWFDQDFRFEDSVSQIHAAIIDNKPYLIFDMENGQGVESGQKRFLFTGNKLILES